MICAGEKAADLVGDAAVAGAGAAADTVMGGVVSWAADGAAWIVSAIGTRIDRSTRPALDSPWYARRYATMVQLAVALSAVFLLLATGQAIVRQDFGCSAAPPLSRCPWRWCSRSPESRSWKPGSPSRTG